MHCRVRYLLNFDLKIHSGQVWCRNSNFVHALLMKTWKKNTFKSLTRQLKTHMIPILGTNLWPPPWWRALVCLCWWEDKWGLDVRVHCAWWQTTHAFCAPQDGGRPHLLDHVVLTFFSKIKAVFSWSIFIRAVIDHMICYDLNWPKIKLWVHYFVFSCALDHNLKN